MRLISIAAAGLLVVSKIEAFNLSQLTNHATARGSDVGFTRSKTQIHGFFGNFFDSKVAVEKKQQQRPVYETVVIDPDFRVAGLFLGLGAALDFIPYIQLTLGPLVTVLGLLFFVQTLRIRFVFDEENCIELKTSALSPGASSAELRDSGENVIVGGANRWGCDTIVNYDFFPQSWMEPNHPIGPILVYFKETQTDESTWSDGPGKFANDPAKIAAGTAVPGQVHFFPAVCNAQQIKSEFAKRGCGKLAV